MLFVHPSLQLAAILLTVYVFYLGLKRFRFRHLHKKVVFPWKRHVILGLIALISLLSGMIGGMIMVYIYWQRIFMTGVHGKVAITMIPFILFGIISGLYLNAVKNKRKTLALMHGINNLIILCLVFFQVFTGWRVLKTFVIGL